MILRTVLVAIIVLSLAPVVQTMEDLHPLTTLASATALAAQTPEGSWCNQVDSENWASDEEDDNGAGPFDECETVPAQGTTCGECTGCETGDLIECKPTFASILPAVDGNVLMATSLAVLEHHMPAGRCA